MGDDVDQLTCCDVVGFQLERIDDDFNHLGALSGQRCLKHTFDAFNGFLQILGHLDKRAFGDIARQVNDDDRELGKVDFVDGIIIGPVGEFAFDRVHRVANVGHGFGLVPTEIEFQRNTCVVFGRRRGHGL